MERQPQGDYALIDRDREYSQFGSYWALSFTCISHACVVQSNPKSHKTPTQQLQPTHLSADDEGGKKDIAATIEIKTAERS